MSYFQHILCAIDFSPSSDEALKVAEAMALESGAELLLVHAFDLPVSFDLQGQTHPHDPAIQQRLDAVTVKSGVRVLRVAHAGPPHEVISWLAQDRHCDLVVMGTHGRTGLKHALLGSVAEHVLRHAPCPVLVVRSRHPEEPKLAEPHVMPVKPPRLM